MNLTFLTIQFVCISVGAGAAFLFDSFFFVSKHTHKVRAPELKTLRRLSLMSLVGSIGALSFYFIGISQESELVVLNHIDVYAVKTLFLALAFLTSLALRRIHLVSLVRYQKEYDHLSDTMLHHPSALVGTCTYSTISWMFVLFLTAFEAQHNNILSVNILNLVLLYVALSFILSKLLVYIKKHFI